jgi:biopolymer transport protein ExbD
VKPDVYSFTKDRVSKLIGEQWKCEYYDNFYNPRKEIVLNITEVDKIVNPLLKRNEIIIAIDAAGKLYINSDNPTNPDKNSLKKSILSQPDAKNANIVIYADANAPNQAFVTIVATLNELGFSTVSIATQ